MVTGVAAPVLLLVGVLGFTQVRREQREAGEMASRIANATSLRVRDLHGEASALLAGIAAQPAIAALDPSACGSASLGVIELLPRYAGVILFDGAGRVVCSGSVRPAAVRPWIQQELRAGRLKPGTPAGRSFGERAYLATAARVGTGTIVLAESADVLARAAFVSGGTIVVRGRDGAEIARWGGPLIARHSTVVTVPEVGWTVHGGVPPSAIARPVREMLFNGAFSILGSAAILTAVAFALARRIGRPIHALADAAAAAGEGAYTRVQIANGPREVVALAEAFNGMIERRKLADGRMKALSERLLTVQEEERARIARELHDDLGQSLTALKMDVVGLLQATEQPPALAPIRQRILHTLDATVTSVQRISSELRPSVLDDLGLVAAIDAEARVFEERTGIECEVTVMGEMPVDSDTVTAIYRIVQEALTNVARHSNAARTEVRLKNGGDELLLEIRDDGRGVTSEEIRDPFSLGLIGIRERASVFGGHVDIAGVPGRGTTVSVRVPLTAKARLA